MTQEERRIYLIKEMLHEQPQYAGMEAPEEEQGQKTLLRSLFNIRMPAPVTSEFLEIQNRYLQEETERKGMTDFADLRPVEDGIYLWKGDAGRAERCGEHCFLLHFYRGVSFPK